jgi:cation:H+ antiporter
MTLDIVMTIISLGVILLSCSVFVNAIEWFGKKLDLHQGVIGSILAAIGTALPETIIPIIAILFSAGKGATEIGIGAIAGAPFMLGTLAFFVTGLAVIVFTLMGKRTLRMDVEVSIFSKDLIFFIGIYGVAVLTTFFHEHLIARTGVAIGLMLAYCYYLHLVVTDDAKQIEHVDPFYLTQFFKLPANLTLIVFQLLAGLAGITFGAHLFIGYVESLSTAMGVAPLVLSIIITPIATELPEKFNSITWVGKGKDTMALGNITGAMVFQSCFPVVFGIIFTPWDLSGITMVSAVLAFASAVLNLGWVMIRRTVNPFMLLSGGMLYLFFLFYVFLYSTP